MVVPGHSGLLLSSTPSTVLWRILPNYWVHVTVMITYNVWGESRNNWQLVEDLVNDLILVMVPV